MFSNVAVFSRSQDFSDESDQSARECSEDEKRRAMLEAVSGGGGGGRKRKRRDTVVTEAYPESEYNLNPMAASAGAFAVPCLLSSSKNRIFSNPVVAASLRRQLFVLVWRTAV